MDKTLSENQQRLMRRYFVWCYKTTKEELDKIDRYFTQNTVDDYILARLLESEEFPFIDGAS